MALNEIRTFDFSTSGRAALSVRRFERNTADECARLDATKKSRLRSVAVGAGERYQANAGDLVLAATGATVVLPEPAPEIDGLEFGVVATAGTIAIACNSGGQFIRGAASFAYSTGALLILTGTSGGYW